MTRVTRAARQGLLVVALVILAMGPSPSCQPDHDAYFSDLNVIRADVADLTDTTISAHTKVPIQPGKTLIWSGSFQLAWNELMALVDGPVRFTVQPPMADTLNEQVFTSESIDSASYIAIADHIRNDVFGQIDRRLAATFGGSARPRYTPAPSLTPRSQDIVAYAYVFKNLAFATPFEDLGSLPFQGGWVSCFGLTGSKPGQTAIRSQVSIRDYSGPNDFIVELISDSEADQILLAKIPPEATLEETLQAVLARADSAEPVPMSVGDVLMVPKINFDLKRSYDELTGAGYLVTDNPAIASDLFVTSAMQGIRFQLDEEGVRLRDEAHLSLTCAAAAGPQPEHTMVFDRPFLVLLKQTDAERPYFAMWVGNRSLLVADEFGERLKPKP